MVSGYGAPSGVIRFACHLPLGMLAFTANSQTNFVFNHAAKLLSPEFNHNIGRGEETLRGAVGGSVIFVED
jgi:hypothetical protein